MKRIFAAAVALSALAAATQAQAADFILTDDFAIGATQSHFFITNSDPYSTSATLTNIQAGHFTDNYYFAPLVASIGSGSAVASSLAGLTFDTPGLSITAYTLTGAAFTALSDAFVTGVVGDYNADVTAIIGEATSPVFTLFGTSPDALSRQLANVPLDPSYFYKISISATGKATGSTYSGTLDSTTVPEPATWAMMLLGFGAIGFAMRSRRKEQPKVRFAF